MKLTKKKIILIVVASAIAIAGIICCIFVLNDNGGTFGDKGGQVIAGSEDSTEYVFDLDSDVSAAAETDSVCSVIADDTRVSGFEMRFPYRDDIEALLKSENNLYFASVDFGNGALAVPMENVRILTDITTDEYVLTFVPFIDGEMNVAQTDGCTLSFYITEKSDKISKSEVLFMASGIVSAK